MPVTFDHGDSPLGEVPFRFPRDESDARRPLTGMGADLAWELRRVGWDVPGIDVHFRNYGEEGNLVRVLSEVSGRTEEGPFRLRYNLPQGRLGQLNVVTGLGEASVPPGLQVVYFSDNSGPSVTLYVGGAWEADGEAFSRSMHSNSKLNGRPRTYLTYKATGGALGSMVHDNDLGREYEPEGDEPRTLSGAEIAASVGRFVQGLVARLGALPDAPGWDEASPFGDAALRRLAAVEPIPAPDGMPPLYAWVEEGDAYRGSRDGEGEPRPFALPPRGPALGRFDPSLPADAQGYFTYAGHDPATKAGPVGRTPREHSVPAVVELRDLNGVYVVDAAAYETARQAAFDKAEAEGRERITDAELNACHKAVTDTLVPYADYAGGYGEATVVIGRRLGPDEVRLARGAVAVSVDAEADVVRATLSDAATGASFVLTEERALRGGIRRATQAAERACDVTGSTLGAPLPAAEPQPEPDLSFLFR